jgi:antitoxin VapB
LQWGSPPISIALTEKTSLRGVGDGALMVESISKGRIRLGDTVALSIKNARAEQLARELAAQTGESITEAITRALEERLGRLRGRRTLDHRREAAEAILAQSAALPDLDERSADQILGYDELGVP